jgi:hypothetical protein
MNVGVEILLKRMDSHPEEFQGLDTHIRGLNTTIGIERRWEHHIMAALNSKFLTDEERTLLSNKLSSIQGKAFTEAVMRELMSDVPERMRSILAEHKIK